MSSNSNIPRLPRNFFKWYCKDARYEELHGDLEELFEERVGRMGMFKARLFYFWDVIRCCQPYAWKTTDHTYFLSRAKYGSYFKIAWRNVLRHRNFSLTNIAGLSIAIATFYLLLAYVHDELSYESFHQNKDRIYRVTSGIRSSGLQTAMSAQPWGPQMKADLSDVQAYTRTSFYFDNVPIKHGEDIIYEEKLLFVDSTFLDVFTYHIILGDRNRALSGPSDIVISRDMALKYFAGENVLGQTLEISINGEFRTYRVSAVAENPPKNSHITFHILLNKEAQFDIFPQFSKTDWRLHNGFTYLLLRPGIKKAQFEKLMGPFFIKHAGEGFMERYAPNLQAIEEIHLHSDMFGELAPNGNITYVHIARAIAMFILLIGCVNYINLNTALSAKRAKEVGSRKVFGAIRRDIMIQFLVESVLIACLSVVFSLAIIELALPYFNDITDKNMRFDWFSRFDEMLLIGFSVGLASGIYPAFLISNFKPIEVLKGRFQSSTKGLALRRGLIVAQFTLSIVLFIGAAMIYYQIEYIKDKDLGFNGSSILVVNGASNQQLGQHIPQIRASLMLQPGIETVSISSGYPGQSGMARRYKPGNYVGSDEELPSLQTFYVDHEFLNALSIELIEGRNFDPGRPTDSSAYILNEAAVQLFALDAPLGTSMETNLGLSTEPQKGLVIGVVRDFHFESLHNRIEPMVICMSRQQSGNLLVKYNAQNQPEVVEQVENEWRKHFPQLAFNQAYLHDVFAKLHESDFKLHKIVTASSILAIIIACLGLLGLATFYAQQKIKEIGIRKVLGASQFSIMLLLNREFGIPLMLSLMIGAPVSYWLIELWLTDFAYRVGFNYWLFPMSGVVVAFIAALTVSYNSFKASGTNPVGALRQE